MIPIDYVRNWQKKAPWKQLAMVEQDLVISRALIDLYNQPLISKSLVFRGGTALNKLYLNPPARYSEDIDFVQIKAEPIGDVINAIRAVLDNWLGEPKRKLTERSVKLIYKYIAVDATPAKLKIEINTTEHFHVLPLRAVDFLVDSLWFRGKALIYTYELDELVGTKLRALYQRRKGRDAFDLWYLLKQNLINPKQVVAIFNKYCEHNRQLISKAMFEQNLFEKQQYQDFLLDISQLLTHEYTYDLSEVMQVIQDKIVAYLSGEGWKRKE